MNKRTTKGLLIIWFVITLMSGFGSTAGSLKMDGKSMTVDIGIFNTGCGDFEIRAKPLINLSGTTVTNIQFTVRWPANTVNLINLLSAFNIGQQGPVYQSGGFNYAFFSTTTPMLINWVAGNEYLLLSFSHDHSGIGYSDFILSDDAWTQTNNGLFYFELLGIDNTGVIFHQAENCNLGGCGNIDIGIFYTDCSDFEVRARPLVDFIGKTVTNIQFTLKWPSASVNLLNISSAFNLAQQGPVYQSGGFNYAFFSTTTPVAINWTAGNEFLLLSFSHDQTGTGYADFNITNDTWVQTNNGIYYFEILGLDETGSFYQQADNTWLGNCGKIDAGIFSTACGDFEVRLKPHDTYEDYLLTNLQFTISWPENTVNLSEFVAAYNILQQGPVYTVNGSNYAIFATATPLTVNWTAEVEYAVLTFSHDQSGSGYADFLISSDAWTQTNNGIYYIELLGTDQTGIFYHQAENTYTGPCGIVDIGIFSTDCADLEVRLKPHLDFLNNTLTNFQFTISWPANSVNLNSFALGYGLLQQGPVYTIDGTSYAIFATATPLTVNWTAEVEYAVLTFSHDQSGAGYADLLIADDAWTQANNGVYYVELLGSNKTGVTYHQAMNTYIGECGVVNVRALLQGPYMAAGIMNNSLNAEDLIPLSQPYNGSPWNYNGSESVSSIPNDDVVDWVLVEIRETTGDASTATADKTVARQAALLLNNGNIVGLDGASSLHFTISTVANSYVVVKHRNHLPIMSSNPLLMIDGFYPYDFTTGQDKAYGFNAMKNFGDGYFGLVGGDADGNGTVQNPDFVIWRINSGFSSTYNPADFDLNGTVQAPDFVIWRINSGLSQLLP